jgi:hypothetical protein
VPHDRGALSDQLGALLTQPAHSRALLSHYSLLVITQKMASSPFLEPAGSVSGLLVLKRPWRRTSVATPIALSLRVKRYLAGEIGVLSSTSCD